MNKQIKTNSNSIIHLNMATMTQSGNNNESFRTTRSGKQLKIVEKIKTEKRICAVCMCGNQQSMIYSLQEYIIRNNGSLYRVQCDCDVTIHRTCLFDWFDSLIKNYNRFYCCPVCNKSFTKTTHVHTKEELSEMKKQKQMKQEYLRKERERMNEMKKKQEEEKLAIEREIIIARIALIFIVVMYFMLT